MNLGTRTQQPRERFSYTINYSDSITDGDNLQSASASVSPAGLIVENVSVYDPRVKFWVSGGSDKVTYKITITVLTADGRTLEDEVLMKIEEL